MRHRHMKAKHSTEAVLWLTLMLAVCASACGQVRSSLNYALSFDAINAGGSTGQSASYVETVCSIGQEIGYAWSSSAGFADENGFVPSAHYVPVTLSVLEIE